MTIQISLFGFGDERPKPFGDNDILNISRKAPDTLEQILNDVGIDPASGVTVMRNNKLVTNDSWSRTAMEDGDTLTVLMAIEGG
ncbi:MAG: sulfur carrier protein ThiS [Acidiferrobacterales bacterium]|nr:sulfur carrier protein ThiS [Acidiferrobacterales bacterium]